MSKYNLWLIQKSQYSLEYQPVEIQNSCPKLLISANTNQIKDAVLPSAGPSLLQK